MKLKDIFEVMEDADDVEIRVQQGGVSFSCLSTVHDLKSVEVADKFVSKIYSIRDNYDRPIIVIELRE